MDQWVEEMKRLEAIEQWPDIDPCPGHQDLDDLNARFRQTCTQRRTRDYIKNWICPSCGWLYKPSCNLLGDLPPFACSSCKVENTDCYEWSMSSVVINGVTIDPMIYQQGEDNCCPLYAVTAAVDMGRRIRGAFHLTWESAPFHVGEMKTMYQTCTGLELGEEAPDFPHRLFEGYDNTPLVLRTFKYFGIGYFLDTFFDRMFPSSVPRLYIDRFFRVDEKDVFLVTRLLASGYPLVTSFAVGQLFTLANKGQVYLPPPDWGLGSHAIVLTGSGKAPNPTRGGVVETFYAGRNGHGPVAHSNYHMQNFGGDFLIFASDVRLIWGFTLRPESAQYAFGSWPMSLPPAPPPLHMLPPPRLSLTP